MEDPEDKKKAKALFKELEDDLIAWCYSIEMYYCTKCSDAPEGHKDKQGKKEIWHVLLVGQNNWNEEPWGEKYSFSTQAEAWAYAKALGDKWMV